MIRAFRNRALETAALALDEVLVLQEAGLPMKVVTVLDISTGGDVILARLEITALADLSVLNLGSQATFGRANCGPSNGSSSTGRLAHCCQGGRR